MSGIVVSESVHPPDFIADKKLLITCLQFLNNLVARNEQRKLMLWIELFDSHLENDMPNFADLKFLLPQQDGKPGKAEERQGELKNGNGLDTFKTPQQPASSPFLLYIGRVGPLVKKTLTQNGEKPGATEIAAECKRRWQSMSETERNVRPRTAVVLSDELTFKGMEHALRRRYCKISG